MRLNHPHDGSRGTLPAKREGSHSPRSWIVGALAWAFTPLPGRFNLWCSRVAVAVLLLVAPVVALVVLS